MFQGNKVVSRREEEIRKSRHELRLKTMRSVVNSSPSPSTSRVTNAKKVLLMEGDHIYRKMHRNRARKPNPL